MTGFAVIRELRSSPFLVVDTAEIHGIAFSRIRDLSRVRRVHGSGKIERFLAF